MKRQLIIFGGLVWVVSANAASFDCAKAGTKVEKLICADEGLSKLDEELAASYKAALQNKLQVEAIKQAQKQWMMERNGCMDAGCVQSAYRKRVVQLHSSQNTAPQAQPVATTQQPAHASGVGANAAVVMKKYPPYPDVWDWVLPDREKISSLGVQLVGMDTGDILLNYWLDDKNGKLVSIQPSTLFSHLTVTDSDADTLIASKQLTLVHLSDGTSASIDSKADWINFTVYGIPLTGDRKLKGYFNESIGPAYTECYHGPSQFSYVISDSGQNHIRSVVIFKILDQPKHIKTGKNCISEYSQSFTTRVESINVTVGADSRPLADGGFVMQVEPGVLIRFDKDFKSRSPLIGDKYFVFYDKPGDPGQLEDGWIFINKITGKTYRKGPNYPYEYQSVVDDLYNYLISLKAKKGATK